MPDRTIGVIYPERPWFPVLRFGLKLRLDFSLAAVCSKNHRRGNEVRGVLQTDSGVIRICCSPMSCKKKKRLAAIEAFQALYR